MDKLESLNDYYREGWETDLINLCDPICFSKSNKKFRIQAVIDEVSLNNLEQNTFLDIACGVGTTSFLLHRIYSNSMFHCIDISEKQIKTGQNYVKTNRIKDNFRFYVEDVTKDLEAYKFNYDCVLCNEIIEHLENPSILLKHVKHIGNQSTQFIFSVPLGKKINDHIRYRVINNDNKATKVYDNINKFDTNQFYYEFYHKNYAANEIIQILNAHNFEIRNIVGANFLGNYSTIRYYIDKVTKFSIFFDRIFNKLTFNKFAKCLILNCRKKL